MADQPKTVQELTAELNALKERIRKLEGGERALEKADDALREREEHKGMR